MFHYNSEYVTIISQENHQNFRGSVDISNTITTEVHAISEIFVINFFSLHNGPEIILMQ